MSVIYQCFHIFCLHSQLFLVWNLVELLEGLPGEDFD